MIVWRGFGFAAFLLGALGVALGVWLSGLLSGSDTNGPLIGLGLTIGGVATFALGWYLNVLNPAAKTEKWTAQRQAELQQAVASGRFQATPGVVPASAEEARVQADLLLDNERSQVAKRFRNIHTLFWIPMQWWGVVFVVIAIVVAIVIGTGS